VRVLIVHDDSRFASVLQGGLRSEGMAVDVTDSGEGALSKATQTAYDVVVLDVMLPGIDGFEVCRRLRSMRSRSGILMLTARDRSGDRAAGIECGADDYMTKPFSYDELLARLWKLAARPRPG
jgi:two-component system, OmpR family, response regulator